MTISRVHQLNEIDGIYFFKSLLPKPALVGSAPPMGDVTVNERLANNMTFLIVLQGIHKAVPLLS